MGSSMKSKCDGIEDYSKTEEYKELSYKLFQLQDYQVKSSNGEFKCPFCPSKDEDGSDYTHLLQHAIQVAEGSVSGKESAKHSAMARYLALDLAHEVKAVSSYEKGLSLFETAQTQVLKLAIAAERQTDTLRKVVGAVNALEGKISEMAVEMKAMKERVSSDELQDVSKIEEINNSSIQEQRESGSCLCKQSRINNPDEESDITDSEIYEHKERMYKLLKSCTYTVWGSIGQLRCPFCSVEEYKEYDHLLLHALMVAEGSSENAGQRGNHLALAKYLVIDLKDEAESAPRRSSLPASASGEDDLEIEKETRERTTPPDDINNMRQSLDDEKRKENELMKNLFKENEVLERSYQNLLASERKSNAELQGARLELIKGLKGWLSGYDSGIAIKQMGEIDVNVFKRACCKRFESERDAEIAAFELHKKWQQKLKNPKWHPFQMVENEKGNLERILQEEDASLRGLKQEWGDKVYSEVVTVLEDLYQYGASRCDTAAEIWNFKENRKAELEEVIRYVLSDRQFINYLHYKVC